MQTLSLVPILLAGDAGGVEDEDEEDDVKSELLVEVAAAREP